MSAWLEVVWWAARVRDNKWAPIMFNWQSDNINGQLIWSGRWNHKAELAIQPLSTKYDMEWNLLLLCTHFHAVKVEISWFMKRKNWWLAFFPSEKEIGSWHHPHVGWVCQNQLRWFICHHTHGRHLFASKWFLPTYAPTKTCYHDDSDWFRRKNGKCQKEQIILLQIDLSASLSRLDSKKFQL